VLTQGVDQRGLHVIQRSSKRRDERHDQLSARAPLE
jgi:hypothetical protein